MPLTEKPLLEVYKLTCEYKFSTKVLSSQLFTPIKAVNNVSFKINKGKTLGIVGESGSGKSTLARSIVQLIRPTNGDIFFNGDNITKIKNSNFFYVEKAIFYLQNIYQL